MKPSVQNKLAVFATRIAKRIAEREAFIRKLQAKCEHPVEALRDAPFVGGTVIDQKPFRVCTLCGYAEEGWGCGYLKLRVGGIYNIPELSQDDARKYVLTYMRQDDMYGGKTWRR